MCNVLDESVFEEIKKRSEAFFRHSHHSESHVARVYNLAIRMAEKEDADLDVIKASVLLHDVARATEDEGKIEDHAAEGAKMARKILREVDFPQEKVEKVVHCIEAHRFRNRMKVESPEAGILQDADRLDMLGAVGIARVFARGGWQNMPIHDPAIPPKERYDGRSLTSVNHICEKILKIKDTLNTVTAREIADERHRFVEDFLERFLRETKGEI